MTRVEAIKASLALLGKAFDRAVDAVVAEAYRVGLGGLSPEQIQRATQIALRECKFMPPPAELRRLVGVTKDRVVDAQIAWSAVRCAIDQLDYTASVDFGPLINAVIRNLGGWDSLCRAGREELDVWRRKEFERVYGLFCDKTDGSLSGDPLIGALRLPPVRVKVGNAGPDRPAIAPVPRSAGVAGVMAEEHSR